MSRSLPDLAPLIAELREAEPGARAFLVFGSFGRGDAGPYSDIDLRVITAGPPAARDRVRFLGGRDAPLVHVSIGSRSYAELVARAAEPSGWAWIAGFCASARVIDDAHDLLGALRRVVEAHRPARLTTTTGMHYDLETLLEYLAKCKNARVAGDDRELFAAARLVADYAADVLLPLNGVAPVPSERGVRARALAFTVAPPGYREDHTVCAGYTAGARGVGTVFAAAMRLGEGVVRVLMERVAETPLEGALAGYLRDGTVLRYVRQGLGDEWRGARRGT